MRPKSYISTEYFSEDELRRAAQLVNQAMLDALPDSGEYHHTFSPEFHHKMAPLLAKARRMDVLRRWTRRAVAALLAIVIGLSSWLAVDIEARAAFLNWIRSVTENSIIYSFFRETSVDQKGVDYYPDWLPEGYEQADVITDPTGKLILYQDKQDETNLFSFGYFAVSQSTRYKLFLGETQYRYTELQVHGSPAHFYQSLDSGQTNNLIWFNKDETIMFSLEGFLEQSVMLHIAESVNLED